MNPIEQSMTSVRFLAEGEQLKCVCCDTSLFKLDGFCSTCQAPTSLSRAVVDRAAPSGFISVLGASGAGKTVYLGMLLDMLTKGTRELQGLPNNSLSVAVQEQTISALENRQFPEKTPNDIDQWNWLHCELNVKKRRRGFFDIISPDFAGEALSYELEHPGTFPVVDKVIRKSEGIVFLVDSMQVRDNGRDEDFFAMKLATYINNAHSRKGAFGSKKKAKVKLAIVFTKCDSCHEAVDDPQAFANANMPGFTKYLERNFAAFKFFSASVVGSTGTLVDRLGRIDQIPFHVSPHGIIEPVEWLIS
ncbi:MAG: hypothetical protein KDB27_07980 [Planctomycetales bacterium]|nr:hypothetical protein [Planctomycetales bacterium]